MCIRDSMYVDLSSIHTKQTASNYKTVQARLLSLYTKNNVIADYDTNFTFYRQQPNATVTMTAWKISKPTFYAENGYPIDTLPQMCIRDSSRATSDGFGSSSVPGSTRSAKQRCSKSLKSMMPCSFLASS